MFLMGLNFCWSDRAIRVVLCYLVLISFCLHGPLMACIPILTKVNLGLGEKAFGTLYAMIGIGTVIGAAIAFARHFTNRQLGIVVLSCDFVAGFSLFLLGFQSNPWTAGMFLIVIGVCSGIIMVAGTTWFQLRTPGVYMGRVMAILMFSIVGLVPISSIFSGYLIKLYSVAFTMNIAGMMMVLGSLVGLAIPFIRNMGNLPGVDFDDFASGHSASVLEMGTK